MPVIWNQKIERFSRFWTFSTELQTSTLDNSMDISSFGFLCWREASLPFHLIPCLITWVGMGWCLTQLITPTPLFEIEIFTPTLSRSSEYPVRTIRLTDFWFSLLKSRDHGLSSDALFEPRGEDGAWKESFDPCPVQTKKSDSETNLLTLDWHPVRTVGLGDF